MLLLAVAAILLRLVVIVLRLSGGSRLLRSAVLLRIAGKGDGIIVIISVVSGSGLALFYIQALFLERRGADSTADGGPQSIGRGIVTDKITRIIGGGSTGIARIDYGKDHKYHEVAAKAIVLILLCLYGIAGRVSNYERDEGVSDKCNEHKDDGIHKIDRISKNDRTECGKI